MADKKIKVHRRVIQMLYRTIQMTTIVRLPVLRQCFNPLFDESRLRSTYKWAKISQSCKVFEPPHDKTNKMACAPSEDSDQPGHSPSLIRVFAVRMKKDQGLSYPLSEQRRLWSDWADAQADLSLRRAHLLFCWFLMTWLICGCPDWFESSPGAQSCCWCSHEAAHLSVTCPI